MTCLPIAVFLALHLFYTYIYIYIIFLLFTNKCIYIYIFYFFSILFFVYSFTGGIFLDFGSGNSFALHLAAARFPQLEMAVGIEREMGSQSSWENSIDVKAREVSENVDATGGCAVITINGDLTKCRSLSKSVTAAYVFVAHPLQAHWAVFLCAQANCVLRVTAPNKDCVDGLGLPEGCRMPRKLSMTCHRDSCHAFVFALTKKQWNVVERTMTSEPFLQHHPEFRARLDAKRVEDERELRAARARAGSVRSVRSSAAEKKNEVVARGEENAAGAEGDAPLPSNDGSMSVAHLREATMTDADRNTSPWAMAGVLDQITSFGKDGLCWQVLKHITRLNETRADVPKRNRTTSIARYSPSFETPPKKNSSENCQTNQQSSSGQKQRQASSSKKQTSSTSSSTSSTSSTSSASSTSSRSGRSGRSSASTSASASGRSTGKGHGQGVAGRRSESDSDGRSGDRGPVNHDGVAAAPTNTRARRSSTSTSASFSSTTSTSGRSTRSSASTSRAVAANQLQQGASSGKKFGKAVARRLHRSAEAAAVAKQLGRNANDPGAFSVGFLVACLCFELHRNQPLNNPNAVHHALHAEAAATGKRKAATSPVNARKKSRTRVTRSQQQDISETEKRNLNGTFEVEGSDDDDDDAVAPNGRDPLVLMYSPPEGASDSAVTLFQSDVERLSQRDGLLNGRLLDFMLLRLSSTKRTVGAVGEAPCGGTAASSEPQSGSGVRADGTPVDHSIVEKSFFCSTSWHAQAWPRKQSINFFVYRFVFVPVQEGNHWFLVVLVNLDNLKANWRAKKKSQAAAAANASDSRAPYVLVLDSSKAARGAAGKRKLREVLSNLFRNLDETWTSHCSQSSGGTEEERGAEKDKDHADFEAHVHGLFFDRSSSDSDHKPLPVRMAEVPQQTNRCDSGAYCYQNAEEVCVRGREVSEVSDADLKRNSFLHGSFNATMYAASDVRGKRAAFARLIGALRSEKETEKRTLNGAFEVEGSEDDDDAVAPNGHAGDDEEGYGGRRAPCEWAWADVWAHANYLGWKVPKKQVARH